MIPNDPEDIRPSRPRGTWVAHQLVVRGLAAVCVLSMGCIPTEEIDFPEEPQCPPSIVSQPGATHPLREIVVLTTDELGDPDAGAGSVELVFEVEIRDCNVDQDLRANVWLNFLQAGGSVDGRVLEEDILLRSTGSSSRDFDFRVSPSELALDPGVDFKCHRVELFVSSEFTGLFGRQPATPGDLDTATWFVAVRRDRSVLIDPSDLCQ